MCQIFAISRLGDVNKSWWRNFLSGMSTRDGEGYLCRRIPVRAGDSRLKERRREKRNSSFSVTTLILFFHRAAFFSLPRFYYSQMRCDLLCAYRPIHSVLLFNIIALYYYRLRRLCEDILILDYWNFPVSVWAITLELCARTFSILKFHAWIFAYNKVMFYWQRLSFTFIFMQLWLVSVKLLTFI